MQINRKESLLEKKMFLNNLVLKMIMKLQKMMKMKMKMKMMTMKMFMDNQKMMK